MTVQKNDDLTKKDPERSLLEPLHKKGGRNNRGRITMRHRGGGAKRLYRVIDFKRNKLNVPGKVAAIEYDPNRNARIALIHYLDGDKRYIIAPKDLNVATRSSRARVGHPPGQRAEAERHPCGTTVHNLELEPGRGAKLVRAAGTSAQLMAKEGKYAYLRMPSGELRLILQECMATIGQVGNETLRTCPSAGREDPLAEDVNGSRYGDEPCGPPHGRRRRQEQVAQASVSLGNARKDTAPGRRSRPIR